VSRRGPTGKPIDVASPAVRLAYVRVAGASNAPPREANAAPPPIAARVRGHRGARQAPTRGPTAGRLLARPPPAAIPKSPIRTGGTGEAAPSSDALAPMPRPAEPRRTKVARSPAHRRWASTRPVHARLTSRPQFVPW
jgi:hypothetical protein